MSMSGSIFGFLKVHLHHRTTTPPDSDRSALMKFPYIIHEHVAYGLHSDTE
jgi:hypothetical protein